MKCVTTTFFAIIFIICLVSSCDSTPQKRAETAVEFWQGYILRYNGTDYRSLSFDEVQPIFDIDSIIVGWTIDHQFSTKVNADYKDISKKRYYLDKDFGVVYACPNFPELNSPPKDSIGLAAIRGEIEDPFSIH